MEILTEKQSEKYTSLFPSIGEYPVYDLDCYNKMEEDSKLGDLYEKALENICEGKDVLDIGTGAYADWALFSLECGAKSTVGLEVIKETFEFAKAFVSSPINCPIQDPNITLVNCYSTDYKTDQKFDIIVSEIIGNIASSEGVIGAIKDAKRLLKPGGTLIPYRVQTLIAGIDTSKIKLAFHNESEDYVNKIFALNEGPFDLRVCLTDPRPDLHLTDSHVVEDLYFEENVDNRENDSRTVDLTVLKDGKISGFCLWINLFVTKDLPALSAIDYNSGWEVVYFPMFDAPLEVTKGQIIEITFERYYDSSSTNPDYSLYCKVGDVEEIKHFPYLDKSGELSKFYKEILS